VFFAGGELCGEEELMELARSVALYGASGLCAGRNVFQRESAAAILSRMQEIVLAGSGAPPSRGPFTTPTEWGSRPSLRVAND